MSNKRIITSFSLAVVLFALTATLALATDSTRSYRLVVDRPLEVAGTMLEPGKYDVTVTMSADLKARLTFSQKDVVRVETSATCEPVQRANGEDGFRALLRDGGTRVLEKIWFRGGMYQYCIPTTGTAAEGTGR